jgi:hypothetical protein
MVGDEAVVRERERWRSRLRADVVERVGGRVRKRDEGQLGRQSRKFSKFCSPTKEDYELDSGHS